MWLILHCKYCGAEFKSNRAARNYCSRVCSNLATGSTRAQREPEGELVTVWSSGGGVQSTAIAALIETGKLQKPDYGVFVDCGYERQDTLQYVHEITKPRMERAGVPFLILKTKEYTNNNLTDGKGHVNIPAFRRKPDGTISKLHTHCNQTWKVRVTQIWMRSQGIQRCENWLGISVDETRRCRESAKKWVSLRYPLVELGMSREDCIYEIANAGWPMPRRTSCAFCPQQDNRAWERLRAELPDDWLSAVEIEKIIQREAPDVFLHRSCRPLSEAIPPPISNK